MHKRSHTAPFTYHDLRVQFQYVQHVIPTAKHGVGSEIVLGYINTSGVLWVFGNFYILKTKLQKSYTSDLICSVC